MKKSIVNTLFINISITILVSIFLSGYFWISFEYSRLEKESSELYERSVESHKKVIQRETERLIKIADSKRNRVEERLKEELKDNINFVHKIATSMYQNNYKTKSEAEIKNLIISTFRDYRYNQGRGYYFISSIDNVIQLQPLAPEMEKKPGKDIEDPKYRKVMEKITAAVKKNKEAYIAYNWYKPGAKKNISFPKITFAKYFEPFDWYIGTGEYLDFIENKIKEEFFELATETRYGKDDEGYIFIFDLKGLELVNGGQKESVGKNIWDFTDVNGVKVIQQLSAKALKNAEGGFVKYHWWKAGDTREEITNSTAKISFVKLIPEWDVFIGTGLYIDDVEQIVKQKKDRLHKEILSGIKKIFTILSLFILIYFSIAKQQFDKIKSNFKVFADFFRQSVSSNLKLDESKLDFQEFKLIAQLLNSMIKKRIKKEEEVEATKTLLRNIINSMPSVLISIDHEFKIIELNHEAKILSQSFSEELIGKELIECFPVLLPYLDSIKNCVIKHIPTEKAKNSLEFGEENAYWDIMIYPINGKNMGGAVIRMDNTTEKTKIEEMMVQTEKMMSIGGLAAGMAHEINNPLGSILQGCQNIIRRVSADLPQNKAVAKEAGTDIDKVKDYLEKRHVLTYLNGVKDAGERASVIVDNMLTFSRRSQPVMVKTDIVAIIENSINLAMNDYDLKKNFDFKRIKITKDFPSRPLIPCVTTEIEQVILNLLKNAAHAMPKNKPGFTPLISLCLKEKEKFIEIEVEDNALGIDEETKKRIFEPFFTTKEEGVGTGLGLSVSYFIISRHHKGNIMLDSKPGKGSKFTIKLPR